MSFLRPMSFARLALASTAMLLSLAAASDAGASQDFGAEAPFAAPPSPAVDDAVGAARQSYTFSMPSARGGVGRSLALNYSHRAGTGDAGHAWSLNVPVIERVRGLATNVGAPPEYAKYPFPSQTAANDRFTFDGQPLVEVCLTSHQQCAAAPGETFPGVPQGSRYFRMQVEGLFARFFLLPGAMGGETWLVQYKDGITEEYGAPRTAPFYSGNSTLVDQENAAAPMVVRWHLARRYDLHADAAGIPLNMQIYRWSKLGVRDLPYLTDVFDTSMPGAPDDVAQFLHHTHIEYEAPDYHVWNGAMPRLAQKEMRISRVDVASKPFSIGATREQVRRYWFTYYPQANGAEFVDGVHAPVRNRSFLKSIQLEGRCATPPVEVPDPAVGAALPPKLPVATNCGRMPPTTYRYSPRGLPGGFVARNVLGPGPMTGNPSDPYFWRNGDRPSIIWDPQHAMLLDYDQDGWADVVSTDKRPGQSLDMRAFRQQPGVTPTFQQVCVERGAVQQFNDGFLHNRIAMFGHWGAPVGTGPFWRPTPTSWHWATARDNVDAAACPPSWSAAQGQPNAKFETFSGAGAPAGWTGAEALASVADFDRDGRPDLLLRPTAAVNSTIRFGRRSNDPISVGGIAPLFEPVRSNLQFHNINDWLLYFVAADLTGDGVPDTVTFEEGLPASGVIDLNELPLQELVFAEGRGNGQFYCQSPPCDTYSSFFWNDAGTAKIPVRKLAYSPAAQPMVPIQPRDAASGPEMFRRYPAFQDVNGDGLADIVQVVPAHLADSRTVADEFVSHLLVKIWLNEGNGTFKRLCSNPACGPFDDYSVVAEQPSTLGIGWYSLQFADMNGNGTTDIVIIRSDRIHVLDIGEKHPTTLLDNEVPAGLLTKVENGLGASTSYTYEEVHAYANTVTSPTWTTKLPMHDWVVQKVETSNGLNGVSANNRIDASTTYDYVNPAFDPDKQSLAGFGRVIEHSPSGIIDTEYKWGPCQTLAGCEDTDSNAQLALSGKPTKRTHRSYNASQALTETRYQYDAVTLYSGVDGRPVRWAPSTLVDTYLYDPNNMGPAVTETNVVFATNAFGQNEPITITITLAGTPSEKLRRTTQYNNRGDVTASLDWGKVIIASNEPHDEIYISEMTPGSLANAWATRTVYSKLSGSNSVMTPIETRSTYLPTGELTLVEGFLDSASVLDRFHATAGAATAPVPVGASAPGWITRASTTYNAFGQPTLSAGPSVLTTRGASASCAGFVYDAASEFVATSRTYTGPCLGAEYLDTETTYDRGFGVATAVAAPDGGVSVQTFDEFGRVHQTFAPNSAWVAGYDPTPATQTTYEVNANGPTQRILVQARHAGGTYRQHLSVYDGLGNVMMRADQADPSAGDGGQWVIAGQVIRRGGSNDPSAAFRPWFFSGANPRTEELKWPEGNNAPQSFQFNYDNFGRQIEIREEGVLVQRKVQFALSTYLYDAEDLKAGGAHEGTHEFIATNGHLQPEYTARILRTGSVQEDVAMVRSFNASGRVTSVVRHHGSIGGPPGDSRTFFYDTLGRLQWTTEPNTTGAHLFRYAYDDADRLIATSDPRGCGANLHYDPAGRMVARDVSPCEAHHEPYTPPNLVTGEGTETFYVYDAPEPGEPSSHYDGNAAQLRGRIVSVRDRGAHTRFGYNTRGLPSVTARRIVRPGTPSADLDTRYAATWFVAQTSYDDAQRVSAQTTGANIAELRPGGDSYLQYAYSLRGALRNVGGSYGSLIYNKTYAADGAPLNATFNDAAATTVSRIYDARRRVDTFQVSRTAPSFWTGAATQYYTPPPASGASVKQTILTKLKYTYDASSNPLTIEDQALEAQWPTGAKPTRRTFGYDSFYRVTSSTHAYRVGSSWTNDAQVAPFQYENGIGDTRPIPARTITNRVRSHAIAYDWQGNTTSISDNSNAVFDRGLPTIVNGAPDGMGGWERPNQLRSAGAGNAVVANYDNGGNLVDLVVKRTGTCTAGKCNQRFVYRWDEEGKLASARRWDYTTIPAGEPVHPNLPARAADWEDRYAYSGVGRTLKTDRNAAGVERHTLEVSGMLRVQRAVFDAGTLDYTATADNEVVYLPGIGRAQYFASGMPIRAPADKLHVFYQLGDTLGSTSVVFDKATSELVESATYDAWGRTESDYRPARWAGFREDYRFTQKEEDIEVGATYFGARYYSPYLGRWLSPDPLTIHAGGADSNPYAYVGGWLGKATDPLGLDKYSMCASGSCELFEYTPGVETGSNKPEPEPDQKSDGKAAKKMKDALDTIIDEIFEAKWGHALARVPDRALQPPDSQRYQAFAIGGANGALDVLFGAAPWVSLRLTPPQNSNWYAQHVLNGDSDGGRKGSRFGITLALAAFGGEALAGLTEVKAGATVAGEAAAADAAAGESEFVNLASPQRTTHILDGDANGGGHFWPGRPGKTPFPESWSREQIMHHVSDIATDPSLTWTQQTGRPGSFLTNAGKPARFLVVGQREGVTIKVVIAPAGEGIITAYPPLLLP